MTQPPIRFDDGEAYERLMGVWSQSVGDVFLDWLPAGDRERWLDVGCGNGTFTEQIIRRRLPADVQGIDLRRADRLCPNPGRRGGRGFQVGNAMTLPFADDRFDAAAMTCDFFHTRPGQSRRRNGTCRATWRADRSLYMGPAGWRQSTGANLRGDARHGPADVLPAGGRLAGTGYAGSGLTPDWRVSKPVSSTYSAISAAPKTSGASVPSRWCCARRSTGWTTARSKLCRNGC